MDAGKKFAASTLPTLERHKKMVEEAHKKADSKSSK
jgi:hypothetical protein